MIDLTYATKHCRCLYLDPGHVLAPIVKVTLVTQPVLWATHIHLTYYLDIRGMALWQPEKHVHSTWLSCQHGHIHVGINGQAMSKVVWPIGCHAYWQIDSRAFHKPYWSNRFEQAEQAPDNAMSNCLLADFCKLMSRRGATCFTCDRASP